MCVLIGILLHMTPLPPHDHAEDKADCEEQTKNDDRDYQRLL